MFPAFLFLITYASLIWILYYYWMQIPLAGQEELKRTFMVVIPFRNDLEEIRRLVAQKEPEVMYILVNDHSSDLSSELITEFEAVSGVTVIDAQGEGKKHALETGISQVSTSYVITTDADCVIDPRWYRELVAKLERYGFVFGPLIIEGKNWWERMQQYEMAILQMVSGSSWYMGLPTMCNGANLGFSRKEFETIGGYGDSKYISSGDDVLLMHAFERERGVESIGYVKPDSPRIKTFAEPSLRRLYHQRKRWAGKWKNYTHAPTRWMAVVVFLLNLTFLALLLFHTLTSSAGPVLLLVVSKLFIDTIILFRLRHYFQFQLQILPLILLSLIYPFYVVFFGLVSHFGSYEWKGREIRN